MEQELDKANRSSSIKITIKI